MSGRLGENAIGVGREDWRGFHRLGNMAGCIIPRRMRTRHVECNVREDEPDLFLPGAHLFAYVLLL